MAITKSGTTRLIVALLLLIVSVTAPVVAQETAQQGGEGTPEAGGEIFGMFDRLEVFLLDVMFFGGGVVFLTGILLWGSAKKSADRAEYGKYAMGTGVVLVVVARLFPSIMSLIQWLTG